MTNDRAKKNPTNNRPLRDPRSVQCNGLAPWSDKNIQFPCHLVSHIMRKFHTWSDINEIVISLGITHTILLRWQDTREQKDKSQFRRSCTARTPALCLHTHVETYLTCASWFLVEQRATAHMKCYKIFPPVTMSKLLRCNQSMKKCAANESWYISIEALVFLALSRCTIKP